MSRHHSYAHLPDPEYRRIQEAGAKARRRGRQLDECPYRETTALNRRRAVAWRSGWTQWNRLDELQQG